MGGLTRKDLEKTKHVLQSPTIVSNSTVGLINVIMIAQALSTGGIGSVLALDPVLIVNGVSFILSQFSTFRRLFSENKPLHIK